MTVFHHDYRYPIYHMRYAWGSDRLEHVHALLHHNGYSRPNGEIYLEWPDYEPTAAGAIDVGFDLSVEWEEGAGRLDNLRLKARRDGKIIGECHGDSCGEWSRADAAQARMYTTWLGVETDFEGKGLGTHLLRRALQEAQAAGYRHAVISTNQYNYRARTLYSNFGYKPTDWTYRMDRELDTTSEG